MADSKLPVYAWSEITRHECYNSKDSFDVNVTVSKLEELISIEALAWLVFQAQLARYTPESVQCVSLAETNFATMFDDVQLVQVEAEKRDDQLHVHL